MSFYFVFYVFLGYKIYNFNLVLENSRTSNLETKSFWIKSSTILKYSLIEGFRKELTVNADFSC